MITLYFDHKRPMKFEMSEVISFSLVSEREKLSVFKRFKSLALPQEGETSIVKEGGRWVGLTLDEYRNFKIQQKLPSKIDDGLPYNGELIQAQPVVLSPVESQPKSKVDDTPVTTTSKSKKVAKNAPGARVLKFVDLFCNPSTVERTFKPLVADWRYEYFEALEEKRIKALWISVRYCWSVAITLGITNLLLLFRLIFGWFPFTNRKPNVSEKGS